MGSLRFATMHYRAVWFTKGASALSFEVMNWVWTLELSPMEKLVALALADHASSVDGACWPSNALIAQ